MKRIVLYAAALTLASTLGATAAWAFGTKDVIQMYRDGISDSLIVQKIEHSGTTFHLDANDLRKLRDAGVSDEIVSAMLATEDQNGHGPYYYPYYPYYPYDPYYYPYVPRVTVGLGFGFCRGYYGHRFYPVHRAFVSGRFGFRR